MNLWLNDGSNNIRISDLVSSVSMSGSYNQCCRTIEFSLLKAAFDNKVPNVETALGNLVTLYYQNAALCEGYIFTRECDAEGNTISITCRDRGIYLKKNKGVYGFSSVTPEDITKRICSDFGIPTGYIAPTGVAVTRFFYGVDLYSIIMTAYTKAAEQNGKKYIIRFSGGALNVLEKGTDGDKVVLQGDRNIIASTYRESLENTVTRVTIYDKNGNFIKNADNQELIKLYGVMQEYMKQTDDDTKEAAAAKTLKKKGIERKVTVQNLGDTRLITGNVVYLLEPVTGLYGKFYIDGDTHTWKNGMYFNKLTLSFENMMDEKEVGQDKEQGTKSTKTSGDGTVTGTFVWPAPASKVITSEYGNRYHPISGKYKMHTGIDIGAALGTDIIAADGGTIVMAGNNGGYGKCIKIDHGSGLQTLYAHCSELLVSTGSKVSKGQVIAKVGATGNVTGPHLHFEVLKNGSCVNPNNYL